MDKLLFNLQFRFIIATKFNIRNTKTLQPKKYRRKKEVQLNIRNQNILWRLAIGKNR